MSSAFFFFYVFKGHFPRQVKVVVFSVLNLLCSSVVIIVLRNLVHMSFMMSMIMGFNIEMCRMQPLVMIIMSLLIFVISRFLYYSLSLVNPSAKVVLLSVVNSMTAQGKLFKRIMSWATTITFSFSVRERLFIDSSVAYFKQNFYQVLKGSLTRDNGSSRIY